MNTNTTIIMTRKKKQIYAHQNISNQCSQETLIVWLVSRLVYWSGALRVVIVLTTILSVALGLLASLVSIVYINVILGYV